MYNILHTLKFKTTRKMVIYQLSEYVMYLYLINASVLIYGIGSTFFGVFGNTLFSDLDIL